MHTDGPDRSTVESVLRATRLLSCFRPGEPALSLPELVRRGGYSKTTTYRLLLTLQQAGWLERDANAAFRLTIRMFEIGSILVQSLDVRQEGLVVMRRLSQQSGLSVHLFIAAGPRAVCVEHVANERGLRVLDLEAGASQPLHQSAAPRALLAYNEAELLPELLRSGLETEASSDTSIPGALIRDLADIRQRGYSCCDSDTGVATLGVPVFDRSGQVVAGLGLCGMREEILPRRADVIQTLRRSANDLSNRLGHPREDSAAQERSDRQRA